jgi:hypothetical protein
MVKTTDSNTSQIRATNAIKTAFNEHPSKDPLRILLCKDAAREGLNLQAHCFNLFHFDVPWNPSRLEQRNGRIDRKLQPSNTVYCHYFVYTQRSEDRGLARIMGRPRRRLTWFERYRRSAKAAHAERRQNGNGSHAAVQ